MLRELQNADTMSRSKDSDKIGQEKVSLRIKHVVKKFKDLAKSANDLGDVNSMSEHTIREYLTETKEWKKDLKSYRDLKESIDLEVLSFEIDAAVVTEFNEAYQNMSTVVTNKIAELNKVDKDLGLFS